MRRFIFTILVCLSCCSTLYAQNYIDSILMQIEANNTTLKALQQKLEADKLQNNTGLTLDNPEFGFDYLWGSPSSLGNRTDFSVTQNFDLSTILGMKRRYANSSNSLLDVQYEQERLAVLLKAKEIMIELTYRNALCEHLSLRLQQAEQLYSLYNASLKVGEGNIMDRNKAQLNMIAIRGEKRVFDVERDNLLQELRLLNGGKDIEFNYSEFLSFLLPSNFDVWYNNEASSNPILMFVSQEINMSKANLSLSRSMNLPSLRAGYMSEKVVGETYQGISLGVSIPLWENKNRVKQAKSAMRAAESREHDVTLQFYERLRALYNKTGELKIAAFEYQEAVKNLNSMQILNKALDAGEISLLDYIVEADLYYETINQSLIMERDYQLSLARLLYMSAV